MKTPRFLWASCGYWLAFVFLAAGFGGPVQAAEGTLKWSYMTGNQGISSPAIGADGTIYAGSKNTVGGMGSYDKYLYALNPDGSFKWKYLTGGSIIAAPAIGPDGTIYVGSGDSYVYALNPDGSFKWRYFKDEGALFGYGNLSTPAIGRDGTIYFGSGDQYTVSGHPSYVFALNPDGSLKWRYETSGGVGSSPAVGLNGTIYAVSYNGIIYALNPDGTLLWQRNAANYGAGHPLATSSPVIGRDGTIYVGCGYILLAITPIGDVTVLITGQLGQISSSPVIGADGTIYLGSEDNSFHFPDQPYNLYAFNANGVMKWKYQTGYTAFTPAIGADGTIFTASADNYLYALNPDGSLKWRFNPGGALQSFPAIAPDGTVYIHGSDYYLYAITSICRGLASTCWPMFHRDVRHRGLVTGNPVSIFAMLFGN